MTDDRLGRATAELYTAHPDEFVGRRKQLAAEARAAGETAVASAVMALRRPTLGAWLVNRLARVQPRTIEGLVAVGEQLRDAQRSLDAARMRELTAVRRKAVGAAVIEALAAVANRRPTESVIEQVRATLDAAVADRDIGTEVTSGALTRAQEWSGFGDVGPELTVVPAPAPRRASTPARRGLVAVPSRKADPQPTTSGRVTIAVAELAAADAALAQAQEANDSAAAEVERCELALAEAKKGVRAAGAELRTAKDRRDKAARRLTRANA
ncbi:MAG: hypothetical protein ACR2KJ_03660 [Jatrophihabitans sp.]